MIRAISLPRPTSLLVLVPFAALLCSPSPALAQAVAPSLGSASGFAVLGGPAVTCTDDRASNILTDITGDVGVLLGSGFANAACTIDGAVHAGDGAAGAAYASFLMAYNNLAAMNSNPLTCDAAHTLTNSTLAGLFLAPGVYCVDQVAKTGLLTLDANGDPNAVWIFLVDGAAASALTGTSFNVAMFDGGQPCNVYWWSKTGATMTTSNFVGTILAGAAITVTGGTFDGRALATTAVTMTNPEITGCGPGSGGGGVPPIDKCEPRDHDDDHDDGDDDDDDGDDDHHGDDDHGDDDHHGHHRGHHHHKDGHGHHHDKDDDHEDNNRNSRGSESRGKRH